MFKQPIRRGIFTIHPDGTMFPPISGGFGDDDAPGDDPASTEPGTEPENDLAAQLAKAEADAKKWKSLSLKKEAEAKANADAAARLKEIELSGKSETEKLQAALDEARAQAREATVRALRHQVAAEKGLPPSLAKFLPDVDNEVDMTAAAEELLDAARADAGAPATRQPKSNLLNPLSDTDDDAATRADLINALQGGSAL